MKRFAIAVFFLWLATAGAWAQQPAAPGPATTAAHAITAPSAMTLARDDEAGMDMGLG